MSQITYVDLNEVEAGQENWLAVIAREREEQKREEHKRRLIAEAKDRFKKRERKSKVIAALKFNENHDELGRFSSGSSQQSGSGSESSGASNQGGSGNGGGVSGAASGVESSGAATAVSTAPLRGSPATAEIRGVGTVKVEPNIKARQAAADYCKKAGIEYNPPTEYVKVDKERAKRIADAYEAMKNDPEDPEVKAAYAKMAEETIAQYQAVLDTGLKVEFIDYAKQGDPYAVSPRLAIEDVKNNNHFWVFPTEGGFGSDATFDASKNPLLAPTDYKISGKTACVNDLFRVVHDYFGHCKEGNGMRADGEENAWRSHSAMFSPLARRAMTSETRGQNSWVNFGPHAESNKTASGGETHYADQKVGLLPEWVTNEGAKAFEFIQFTKSLETKIARAAVKAAAAAQHTRVEKQAAQAFAAYFQKSVQDIVSRIPKSFKPDPENAKAQAARLIKRAFKASKQNDLLISSMSQPVADAFLEGAYAEMRLASAAKRRKKGLKFNENHDESGRFATGGGSHRASPGVETIEFDDGFTLHALRNPSLDDAKAKLANSKNGELRGLIEGKTGNVWMWDAEKATHDQVAEKLGLDWIGDIIKNNGRLNIKNEGQLDIIYERLSKSLKYNENHDEAGRFASGDSSDGYEGGVNGTGKTAEVEERITEVLGLPEGSDTEHILNHVGKLLGIPKGADITVEPYDTINMVKVNIEGENFRAERHLDPANKTISNSSFEVFKSSQHQGLGTQILAAQVAEAAKAGYETIETDAVGGLNSPWNGYYTWPRLGYDAPIDDPKDRNAFSSSIIKYAKDHGLSKVSDFMDSAEHRTWWKENGEPFHGIFDLREGSQSRERLARYVAAKQAAAGGGKSTGTDRGRRSDPGQDLRRNGSGEGIKVTTATQAARRAEHEIDFPTEAPEWLTEAAQDFIIETFQEDYWLRIPETTRDDIELTLYEAIRDGKSIRDIASDIQEAHGDEYSKYRALNVARTEMTGAMNAGATESISQAFEGSGLTPTKVWLSVLGTTTRETHAEADGQEVLLDAEFTVGGYSCSVPGDVTLPPEERCNCQCSIISGEVESQISSDEEDGKSFEKFNENHDHLGRFASAPDSGDGSGAQGTSPSESKPESKPPKSVEEVVKRAEKIQFTEGEIASSIDSSDTSEIYDRMTGAERDDMRDYLDQEKQDWIDSQMESYEADMDSISDNIDEEAAAGAAGYTQQDIKNDVGEMVADNEKLSKVVEDWVGRWGDDGIDMLIEELDNSGEDISSELRDKLEAYKNEAENNIQTERDNQYAELEREAAQSARDDYENQWDESDAERSYLERFYEDNPERFQSEDQLGQWVKSNRGTSQYSFKTSDDRRFDINTYQQDRAGLKTTEVQFSDEGGDFGMTGKGKAFEVFGQVVPAVVAYAKHEDPPVMTFSAHGKSRQRLYDRLTQQVLGLDDSRFAFKKDLYDGDMRQYVVGKKSERESIMAKVTADMRQGIEEITPRRSATVDASYLGEGWQEIFPHSDPAWFTEEGWPELPEEPSKSVKYNENHDEAGRFASGSGESPKTSIMLALTSSPVIHGEHNELTDNGISRITGEPVMKPEQLQSYKDAVAKVVDRMPKGAREAMGRSLKQAGKPTVHFFATEESLTSYVGKKFGIDTRGAIISGAYSPDEIAFYLDGNPRSDASPFFSEDDPKFHCYAHEMSHAIDHENDYDDSKKQHSRSDAWKKAWEAEISPPESRGFGERDVPLSKYATTSLAEGWAEFGRIVITDPKTAEEKFPKCWAVWKKNGLVD